MGAFKDDDIAKIQKVTKQAQGAGTMAEAKKMKFESKFARVREGSVEQNIVRMQSLRRLDPVNRYHGDEIEEQKSKFDSISEGAEVQQVKFDVTEGEATEEQKIDRARSLRRADSIKDRKPVNQRETLSKGPNLASSVFLTQRIHQLNSVVNKILGEKGEIRTSPHTVLEDRLASEQQKQDVEEIHLDAVRLSKFRELVLNILRPEHLPTLHKDDEDRCAKQIEHSKAYTNFRE